MIARVWVFGALVLAMSSLLAPIACRSAMQIDLPPPTNLDDLYGGSRRPQNLNGVNLKALYVVPKIYKKRAELPGLVSEDRELALLELVAVLADDGSLYINDVLHQEGPAAYAFGKISPADIELRSPQGVFQGDHRLFSANDDVLVALDSGYQIDVTVRTKTERLVFRPLYDAELYAPYNRSGREPNKAAIGFTPQGGYSDADFDGAAGKSADSGASGNAGKDGKSAASSGQNGGRGGNGSSGSTGSTGSRGGDGGSGGSGGDGQLGGLGGNGDDGDPAEKGPTLEIQVRPIYSKFYPDEELIFMEITATYHKVNDGSAYRVEKKNYILHRGQRFSVASIGGRGGAGGDGGQGGPGGNGGSGGEGGDGGDGGRGEDVSGGPGGDGGDGGNGGNGGDGGDGAEGGRGGNGGRGGRGGDGGEVRATVIGSDAFVRDVRSFITLKSISGEGGVAGSGGFGGSGGSSGSGGDEGDRGDGGNGGNGTPSGKKGNDGKDGDDGDSGSLGSTGDLGGAGRSGDRGRAGKTAW